MYATCFCNIFLTRFLWLLWGGVGKGGEMGQGDYFVVGFQKHLPVKHFGSDVLQTKVAQDWKGH